uniref:Chromatin assembly factor 1 subunit A (Trinotate prediction) n=1 Tax=Henneguya salminicola TaxID=69463 RepID=A0A6G3MFR4_HENSL
MQPELLELNISSDSAKIGENNTEHEFLYFLYIEIFKKSTKSPTRKIKKTLLNQIDKRKYLVILQNRKKKRHLFLLINKFKMFGVEVGKFKPIELKPGMAYRDPFIELRRIDPDLFDNEILTGGPIVLKNIKIYWKSKNIKSRTLSSTSENTIFKAKFLKFYENFRPPYYGTWSKKSAIITGKKPFALDSVFFFFI